MGLEVPKVIFGLHATHQAITSPERVARLADPATPAARAIVGMLSRPRPGGTAKFGVEGHPLHDPCVITYVLWPDLFQGRDCHVAVVSWSWLVGQVGSGVKVYSGL